MSDENRKPIRTLYREYPNIKEAIKKQGWRVEVTKGSHIKFIAPDGSCMFASGTPTCAGADSKSDPTAGETDQ